MSPIPIIELANGGTDRHVVDRISSACAEWGFFQVLNHGVAESLVERVWWQTRRFFEMPRAGKLKILRTKDNPRGYYDRELTKNARDLKEVFDFGGIPHPELPECHPDNRDAVNGCNQWPDDLPGFRNTMLHYLAACEKLSFRLLELFCLGLDSPADSMQPYFRPVHTGFVRLNYYPLEDPLAAEALPDAAQLGDMALHYHSDAGALTILLQDNVGGLQVFAKDKWWDVEPLPGAFVINTADMMQVWSNDRYRAPLHRVLPVKHRPRYSIPFFFNPSYASDCAPLAALTQSTAPNYRPINWGEFRQRRTDGDYADYGSEIQIDDYRII